MKTKSLSEKKEPMNKKAIRFADLARLEDELYEAEKENGMMRAEKWWQKLGDQWFAMQERRIRHKVKKKTYLLLTFLGGWAGAHRFYEKRLKLGMLYLLFCWTGLPAASAVVDFLIALGLPADEEGFIVL